MVVDNNMCSNSHVALVGKAMSSTEEKVYVIMRMINVDYVLLIFRGHISCHGDDIISSCGWCVAKGEHPQDIKVGVLVYTLPYRTFTLQCTCTCTSVLHKASYSMPCMRIVHVWSLYCGSSVIKTPLYS